MKNILYYIGLIFLAIFLFTIHAKYLHFLIPKEENELFIFLGIDLKVYLPYIWGMAFGIITAIILHYLNNSHRLFWPFVIVFALLELTGVFLFNNTEIKENYFRIFSSIYYGIYTGFIIIVYAYIKNLQDNGHVDSELRKEVDEFLDNENEESLLRKRFVEAYKAGSELKMNANKSNGFEFAQKNAKGKNDAIVLQMLQENKSPAKIAEELNINPSTVYRIKKKYENAD